MIGGRTALVAFALATAPAAVAAEDLYKPSNWPAMSADDKAFAVGDSLTVVIFQAAEASNTAQKASRRKTDIGGKIDGTFGVDEEASLEFGGGYTGRGEIRRSERLVAQMSVVVRDLLPNGDFIVDGEQAMRINGETTRIGVRGRVRRADIRADNSVLSSRIANAQINYDGRGFVSRSAKPGIVNRIFSFLGLG
jgi:flagellar L-ring protein precursor FlgH